MNKSIKKWLVLLTVAVLALTALTLVACDGLFGPSDRPERLEIINTGGEVPEDVTCETIRMYIMAQYYDKKGNGNMLNGWDYTLVQFEVADFVVNVTIQYNNLTASAHYIIHREIIKDRTEVIFWPNDQGNTDIEPQSLSMGDYVKEPNTPYLEDATFLGWFTSNENQDGTITWTQWDFSQPITLSGENILFLHGRWEILVTVNYCNDVDGEVYATDQVNIWNNDVAPDLPVEPAKYNYAFDYWYVNNPDDRWQPEDVFWRGAENKVINVCPFYLATFNVVFDTDGGEAIEPLVVKHGEQFSAPQTAAKDGYKFACWSMYDVNYFSDITNRSVFRNGYSIIEKYEKYEVWDGQFAGLEAGATFTVYAEFYSEDEPTPELHFEYYRDSNGIEDESKYIVSRAPYVDNTLPWERTAFAVVIPSTYNGKPVVAIGGGTFLENVNLVAVVLPDTITEIQGNAFANCNNLKDINMPSSVKVIESRAFYGCQFLDVVLPEGLISVGNRAFSGTAFSGSLPSTLKTIEAYAFGSSSNSSQGTSVTSVVLPADLETLGEGAFARCPNLTSVKIESATSQIGANAFSGCAKLTDVTIPDGTESLPNGIFADCSSLESIVLPSTLKSIGRYAFSGAKLTSLTLPEGLLSIGGYAFEGNNITKVVIPSNITEIAEMAFSKCRLLEEVTLPQSIVKIGNGAFIGDSKLISISIPDTVTTIGDGAFENCSKLTEINIPNSVRDIGNYAFMYCSGITSVNLGSVLSVGERAFSHCYNLAALTMSSKIESIGSYAFARTPINFGALTLPNTLELIGREAFNSCTITSLTVNSKPELVISDYAFKDVCGLTSASLLGNIKSIGAYAFADCGKLESVSLTKNIEKIAQNAFSNTSLATLAFNGDLNDWLKVELNSNFIAAEGVKITFNGSELTGSVTITPNAGESLTIGNYALYGLSKVTSLTLNNVKSVGEYAFYGCAELTSIVFNGFSSDFIERKVFDNCGKLQFNEYGNGLYLSNNANEHYLFVKPVSSDITELTLHADTKIIASSALRYEEYPNLASVTLPYGLQVIGEGAFYGCNLVTELVVPDRVVRIGGGAFEGWDALQRLTVPFVGERNYSNTSNTKLKWIFGGDSNSNKYPSNLEYVEVTGGVIDKYAFENCMSLKELNAGKADRMVEGALYGCNNLVKLTVPTSLTYTQGTGNISHMHGIVACFNSSGNGAAPRSLSEVTITGGGAFDGATLYRSGLDKLTLGLGVTSLPSRAFRYTDVTELYYQGTVAQWNSMDKSADWTAASSITVVHCSDGDVDITA